MSCYVLLYSYVCQCTDLLYTSYRYVVDDIDEEGNNGKE